MKRILDRWRALSLARKLSFFLVLGLLLAGGAFAAYEITKRPADISNPEAGFEKREIGEQSAKPPKGRRIDWPRFGYDNERTKFLNAQKIRPPFRKLWKYKQEELIEFAPIIAGKRMYMFDNDALLTTLNVDTGKVVWKKQFGSLNASSPAFEDGVLYVVTLDPGQALAIRANDGKVLWRKSLPSRAESSPIVIRKKVFFGSESGAFYALDRRNGKELWSTQLSGAVKAAPAFTDGTLYVGDYGGTMHALRAGDGAIRWQTGDLGTGVGSGRFYSTPAVAFGRVYAGNVDGRMYSFDRQSGQIAWTFSAGNYVYSGPAAAETRGTRPAVYFGSHDKNVYALDADSGKQIWQTQPGGQVSGPATVVGDVVYLSTFSGNSTSGFDLATGRRVFKFDEGEYGPVVADGERLFVLGGNSVTALKPIKVTGKYKAKKGFKGIVPPDQLRKLRKQERKRAQKQRARNEDSQGSEEANEGEPADPEQSASGRDGEQASKAGGKRKRTPKGQGRSKGRKDAKSGRKGKKGTKRGR